VHVIVETERLLLRQFTHDDLEHLVALDADPAVMRSINGGRPTPRARIRDEILPAFLGYYERGEADGFWAVVDRTGGDFLGWLHLRPAPDAPVDEPELGYRLTAAAWGRGLATEGSRALIDRGFRQYGVRRVVASTMAVNTASRRVMEKLGMRLVGTGHRQWPERIEGDEYDAADYALDRMDWERRTQLKP
jgi:RimJ/RimL family protein N-acetyltransferase